MSYKLADGTLSTDYKLGDKFTSNQHEAVFTLEKDDGTRFPFFDVEGGVVYGTSNSAYHWEYLTPIKHAYNAEVIRELRSTIKG